MYPGDPVEPGSDCAGTVVAVGPRQPPGGAATNIASSLSFVVGDKVFGLAHGCLGTLVTGPACMMALVPPGLSLQVTRAFVVLQVD
jgi:NADPH:quinone reductase-like Zn-dependent oxidoreductase